MLDGKKLIVHRMEVAEPSQAVRAPNRARFAWKITECLSPAPQRTWLEFVELQLEGKKRLGAAEFLRGAGLRAGARLA